MPNDNVMPHQQVVDNQTASAQNNLAGSIPQAPNASGPSAQDILSQVLGGQSQQAPSPIAPPTPTPASPEPTMWSKFLQNALSGLAGGLSAPSGSSDGGALGYKFAQDAEAKRQADAQNAQAAQDKQNQQQFSNQLASNQDQRAQQDQLQQGQMSKYQLASANLNLMNQAQTLANAPEEARTNFYKGQSALTEQYRKDKAPEVAVIDDDDHHGNLTAFFASHPDRTALNTVFTHTDDGKIHVFAPIGLKGDQLNEVARKAGVPATYNDNSQYTPEQTIAAQNEIQKQAFEAGQAKMKERGENNRAAIAHSGAPSNDAEVQAAYEGRIAIPRGKEGAALLSAVTAAHPDFDQSKQVAYQKMQSSLAGGDLGKQQNVLNTAIAHLGRMETNIPDNGNVQFMNDFKNKGLTAMGSDRLSRFNADQEAAVGELAKLYKGGVATQAETDEFKAKVKAASSPQQLRTTIDEFKQLVGGKIGAMENQVNGSKPSQSIPDRSLLTDESRSILSRGMPPQSVADKMTEGDFVHGKNGRSYQKKNGKLVQVGQ